MIVNTDGAAHHLGLAKSTVEKLRVYGGGPRFLKLNRAVRYRVVDLDDWLITKLAGSTSESIIR